MADVTINEWAGGGRVTVRWNASNGRVQSFEVVNPQGTGKDWHARVWDPADRLHDGSFPEGSEIANMTVLEGESLSNPVPAGVLRVQLTPPDADGYQNFQCWNTALSRWEGLPYEAPLTPSSSR